MSFPVFSFNATSDTKSAEEEWQEQCRSGFSTCAMCGACGGSSTSTCSCAKARFMARRHVDPFNPPGFEGSLPGPRPDNFSATTTFPARVTFQPSGNGFTYTGRLTEQEEQQQPAPRVKKPCAVCNRSTLQKVSMTCRQCNSQHKCAMIVGFGTEQLMSCLCNNCNPRCYKLGQTIEILHMKQWQPAVVIEDTGNEIEVVLQNQEMYTIPKIKLEKLTRIPPA